MSAAAAAAAEEEEEGEKEEDEQTSKPFKLLKLHWFSTVWNILLEMQVLKVVLTAPAKRGRSHAYWAFWGGSEAEIVRVP